VASSADKRSKADKARRPYTATQFAVRNKNGYRRRTRRRATLEARGAPGDDDPDGVDPVFSIVIPVRDAEATLVRALYSVVRQSERTWECWVVDDGSRDRCCEIASAFAASDARFRLLRQGRLGIVAALNNGLSQSRGRFLVRLDADDVMHRERLALQRRALEADAALAGVGCHVRLFPRATLTDGLRAYERWLNAIQDPQTVEREALVECPLAHPTWCMRRDVLLRFGYRETPWAEDYDLILRLLAAGSKLAVVPRRLLLWRDGPGRLSRTHERYSQERFTACKAAFLCQTLLVDTADYVLWGYGGTGKSLARALALHGRYPSHIVELHRGRIGQRIAGAPVIPPEALRDVPRRPIVASVAGVVARTQIRQALLALGLQESRDFVVAA
jgi:cellulose synthase/poly-beta-1,6-N-acetylglucosamine synthase-like glycosyltransferase